MRRLERLAVGGDVGAALRLRVELRRVGECAGLDLSLPHSWGVVRAKEEDSEDYGSVLKLLRDVIQNDVNDSGLHPFFAGVSRPLTFKEIVEARLDDLKKTGRFGVLWHNWLDSCSGIVYKANSSKFKVVPLCVGLLSLQAPFRQRFLSVRYGDFKGRGVVELDTVDDVYNQFLSQDQVIKHKGWLAVMENDKKLLRQYAEVVFDKLNCDCMRFWVVSNPVQDQLRALCAYNLAYDCNCIGDKYLTGSACFARVCPL